MSAPANHPSLRAGVSEAIARTLTDQGGAKVAAICGVDRSTPVRRGGSLADWPLGDALALAAEYPEIRDAIIACLIGQEKALGEAIRCQSALFEAMSNSAALVAEASRDLSDGRIDTDEAKRLLPLVRQLRDHLANTVLPSLEAYRHG
jgi:hypothetical protein